MVGCDQRLVLLHCSTTVVPVALVALAVLVVLLCVCPVAVPVLVVPVALQAPPRTTCLKDARHVHKCVCLHPPSSILRPLEGCQTCSQMCLSAIVCILHPPSSIRYIFIMIKQSGYANTKKHGLTTHANYMMNKMHSSTHQRGLKHINLLIPNTPQRYKCIKPC